MRQIISLLLALPLLAATIHNGETFMVPFNHKVRSKLPHTTIGHIALFPIGYYHRKGRKVIEVDGKKVVLRILPKRYKREQLRVAPSKVKPPAKVKRRIEAEYREAQKIYGTVTGRNYIHKPFILPIKSSVTSPFGTARLFNGSLKSYHSGTDFRAPVGTPVRAINDGRVVLAKRRYYAGGSVIIDHGRGLYSCYYHLSKFKVKKGDRVRRGEVIALSGKSGRVTGPHLHLTIKLLGKSVDPLQFIERFNTLWNSSLTPRSP
ncbi:MAG: M23 family metallopeptidase [Epsilonproteobacteria bacterium]|nr:M23 family peptidase [Campylobacterota bacterium]NPA56444.1 M23 family metallopeptidase [Campylobacterota bacterium]